MSALATSIGNRDVPIRMLELFAAVTWFRLALTAFGEPFATARCPEE